LQAGKFQEEEGCKKVYNKHKGAWNLQDLWLTVGGGAETQVVYEARVGGGEIEATIWTVV
jgi:hypothetical protein